MPIGRALILTHYWLHRPQYFIARVPPHLFNGFKTGSQRWFVLQKAICNQVEASARSQHLGSFADKALGDPGGLYARELKRRVGYDPVKTLRPYSLDTMAGQHLHVSQAVLFPRPGCLLRPSHACI